MNKRKFAIITIVFIFLILLIISLNIGQIGFLNKLKSVILRQDIETVREKVENTIINNIAIGEALQELLEDGTFESIDKEENIGNIGEYEIKLKYNEEQKIEIEYIQEATGIRITYTLEPKSYTNNNTVNITLVVKGKIKNVVKPDNLVVYPKKEVVALDYEVTENGKYKFLIEDNEGNIKEKNVIVDIIDRLAPNDFEITAKSLGERRGIGITAETTDADADETNVKSGIERYEYYIKLSTASNYTKYDTNEITRLKHGSYSVYAVAYDKAGNSKTSIVTTVEVEEQMHSKRYVDYGIDLNDDGDTTNDWMIFYEEDGTVNPNYTGATYIIPAYYVPYTKMKTSVANAGMKLNSDKYSIHYRTSLTKYEKNSNYDKITEIFMYDFTGTKEYNAIAASRLLNTEHWEEDFVTPELKEKGGMAIGSPTIRLWCASWNKEYPEEKLTVSKGGTGYSVSGTTSSSISYTIDAPNVYYPTKKAEKDETSGIWLASPANSDGARVMNVSYGGAVTSSYLYTTMNAHLALRPVVFLPPSVKLEESGTPNVWNINYGE